MLTKRDQADVTERQKKDRDEMFLAFVDLLILQGSNNLLKYNGSFFIFFIWK